MPTGFYKRHESRMVTKKCLSCGKEFKIYPYREETAKFCSSRCSTTVFKKGKKPWNDGVRRPKMFSEKHFAWKGEVGGYVAKHTWVKSHKGKPKKCEHCGINKIPGGYKRYFQWANIDHKYKRNLDDYICLCVKCHGKYDVENKLRKHKKINNYKNI